MISHHVASTQSQKSFVEHRGSLVYRQEYGYKLITLLIDLCTCDEQSSVTTRLDDFDLAERAEHIPASVPLIAIDFYHFPAIDGTEIELTIRSNGKEHTARFIVDADGIHQEASSFWLDIMKSSESQKIQSTMDEEREEQNKR
ncbi:MAG: hypothetical protein NVSMB38_27690 [Ktedonobacteraceae bacterium]